MSAILALYLPAIYHRAKVVASRIYPAKANHLIFPGWLLALKVNSIIVFSPVNRAFIVHSPLIYRRAFDWRD
jgi:hypothetical protein